MQYLRDIEMVILNAANKKDFDIKDIIRAKLKGDFDLHELKLKLKRLKNVATSASCVSQRFVSFFTLTDVYKALNPATRNIYKNVSKRIQLYLTIPISNATAERSFSCLRRLKNFLTDRLTQEHLNHRMF